MILLFLVLLSASMLLVYRNATDFGVLIFLSWNVVEFLFISSDSSFGIFGIFYI